MTGQRSYSGHHFHACVVHQSFCQYNRQGALDDVDGAHGDTRFSPHIAKYVRRATIEIPYLSDVPPKVITGE